MEYEPHPYFGPQDHSWAAIANSILREQRVAERHARQMEQTARYRAAGFNPNDTHRASTARGRARVNANQRAKRNGPATS